MGPLTHSLSLVHLKDGKPNVGINLRRPVGKPKAQFEREIREALADWQHRTGIALENANLYIDDPYDARQAPEVPVLLKILRHYTGKVDAQPVSKGGSSHTQVVPNGVCFGPVMPGEPYTEHSEHEAISRQVICTPEELIGDEE